MMPSSKRGFLLALAFALAVSLVMTAACSPKQVPVPNVVGKTAVEAKTAIETAKLKAGTPTLEFSEEVASGTVISQNPAANSQAAEGTPVEIVVSKGKAPIAVPDVKGMDSKAASEALAAVSLPMVAFDEYDANVTAGQSMAQLPAAGEMVMKGTEVVVGFSLGKPPTAAVTVPGVTGTTKTAADAQLKKSGLKVTITSGYVVGSKAGTVISQVPAKGAKAAPGSHVIIMVSSGTPVGQVPSVNGMSRSSASSALSDSGFASNAYQMANDQPAGKVFSQLPASGSEQMHGSTGGIFVSLGPLIGATASAPSVTGETEAAAKADATNAGFVPVVLMAHDPSVAAGTVIAQVPAGGSAAMPGQQIVMTVSQGSVQKAEAKVPTVTKKAQTAAEQALTAVGLKSTLNHLYSPTVAKGIVMGQLPDAGVTVIKGATIQIVVSLGAAQPPDIKMPELKGMSEEAANTEAKNLGLVIIDLGTPSGAQTPGTVVQQFPAAGADVNDGSQVVIVVAR
ncbi:MAG: PASTA domain-containing protein [Actinomycetes bacterium]